MDDARSAVAALIGAEPAEIVFTSGGTEADNFAIRGAAEALEATGRRHLITSGIEHEAVLNTFKALARRGWKTTLLPMDATGIVSPDRLRDAMTDDTALVSMMHANNEIGTIQPVAELAHDRARARRPVSHRRSAEHRQDSGERADARRGPAGAVRAQVLRTQGRRRAVDQARRPAGAASSPAANRSAIAGPARRTRAGLIGMGVAAARAIAASSTPKAPAWRRFATGSRQGILSSVPNTEVNGARDRARAEHDEHQLRSGRGRIAADRPRFGRRLRSPPGRPARRERWSRRTCCGR